MSFLITPFVPPETSSLFKNRKINNIVPEMPPPNFGPPNEVLARLAGALFPGFSTLHRPWACCRLHRDKTPRGSGGLPSAIRRSVAAGVEQPARTWRPRRLHTAGVRAHSPRHRGPGQAQPGAQPQPLRKPQTPLTARIWTRPPGLHLQISRQTSWLFKVLNQGLPFVEDFGFPHLINGPNGSSHGYLGGFL